MFQGKKIALYISGGIAAYKMANFTRSLIKRGAEVRIAMTEAATAFVTPLSLQILTKHEVMVDVLAENNPASVAHIEFAQWADYAVLAPATANSMAKLAHGIADNFVSTALLASPKPVFIVPAMNDKMYTHPSTQKNIRCLREDGHYVMEAAYGFLAEGYEGQGRLPEEEDILKCFAAWIHHQEDLPLKGQSILVSSGGTIERIDPVRYISNDSSGRMGNAIAEAAYRLGAEVTLVSSSQLPVSYDINRIQVQSAQDMYEALHQHFDKCQALVMAAAVSDFTPLKAADQKIKKDGSDELMQIQLKQNPDILKSLGQKKKGQILVGFAAETENLLAYAEKKLKEKNLDMIVVNDVSKENAGFNVSENEVIMIKKNGNQSHVPLSQKDIVAESIMEEILTIMEEKNA